MKSNTKTRLFFVGVMCLAVGVGYLHGDLTATLGADLTAQLKKILTDPLLDLLSCSELTEKSVVQSRIGLAEKAVSDFKQVIDQQSAFVPQAAPVVPVAVASTIDAAQPAQPAVQSPSIVTSGAMPSTAAPVAPVAEKTVEVTTEPSVSSNLEAMPAGDMAMDAPATTEQVEATEVSDSVDTAAMMTMPSA